MSTKSSRVVVWSRRRNKFHTGCGSSHTVFTSWQRLAVEAHPGWIALVHQFVFLAMCCNHTSREHLALTLSWVLVPGTGTFVACFLFVRCNCNDTTPEYLSNFAFLMGMFNLKHRSSHKIICETKQWRQCGYELKLPVILLVSQPLRAKFSPLSRFGFVRVQNTEMQHAANWRSTCLEVTQAQDNRSWGQTSPTPHSFLVQGAFLMPSELFSACLEPDLTETLH